MHKIYFEKRCIVICRSDESQLADPNSVEFHMGEKIDIHALVGMFEASDTLSRIYIPAEGRQEEEIYRRLCAEFKEGYPHYGHQGGCGRNRHRQSPASQTNLHYGPLLYP